MKTTYRGIEIITKKGELGWNAYFIYEGQKENCIFNVATSDLARISCEYLIDYLENKKEVK